MSMKRLHQIAAREDLTMIEFVVAIKLAYHENSETGECFPSIRLLEKETGISHPSILKALKGLEGKGVFSKSIKKDAKKNQRAYYQFVDGVGNVATHGVGNVATQGGKPCYPGVGNLATPNQEYESGNESGIPPPTVSTVGGGREDSPNISNKKQISIFQRLPWLKDITPNTNPFDTIYKGGGMFLPAYDPRFSKTVYDIDGCTLSKDIINDIRQSPIDRALDLIHEPQNPITKKALENRLAWIGIDACVGEVARLLSEHKADFSKCRNLGQLLLRRLEYCYAFKIAPKNFTQAPDWSLLWAYKLAA